MKKRLRAWLRPVLFTLGGALAGLGYHYFVGCSNGACAITANPYTSTVYAAVIGLLLSVVFRPGCKGTCDR